MEAEFPSDIVDVRLNQAVAILEDLLKPVVCTLPPYLFRVAALLILAFFYLLLLNW